MKKFDVIVVGELNIDLIFNGISGFPKVGTETLANKMTLTLGSSSAICASNLSTLGTKVGFVGKVGNDVFGRFTIEKLKEKGVDTSLIKLDDDLCTGATVAMSYEEDRAMVTHQGAMTNLTVDDIGEDLLKQAKHLHFSSYFFQPGFKGTLDVLFKRAKKAGLTTSLDVQWDPAEKWDLDLEKVLPWVDVFLPNEVEVQKLTGQTNLDRAINSLQNRSAYMLIKCGNKGSIQYCNGRRIEKKAYVNSKVVDTIGAGDSFDAGYIAKFIQGKSPEECQEFANIIGAISTTGSGGTSAFKDFESVSQIAKERFNYTIPK